MTAIAATTGTIRSRVDGTLVMTIEFEPNNAQDAFKLFAAPGTQVAIAALQDGYAAAPLVAPKPKPGPLCQLAVQWCKDPQFQIWADVRDEEAAKQFILAECEIESRKEIDTKAAARFEAYFRKPFMMFQKENA